MIQVLLAALVDGALARLPLVPNLHDKRMLGQHAHEDAQALAGLGGPVPGEAPPGDLRALLVDELSRAARDEALVLLARRQERHLLELPPKLIEPQAETVPGRDPFVEIGPERPGPHADLNHALIVAEVAAATAAAAAFDIKLELAALAAAKLDETAEIERRLEAPWGSEPVDLTAYHRLMELPAGDRVQELLGEGRGSDEQPAG